MIVRALTWNLFHGRDMPPDPALLTWRSRLLRISERNATHLQLNRDLLPEFSAVLADARWDVALLQECPPRWREALAQACAAEAHGVLTSRNSLGRLRTRAARINPDLVASNEGGSNLTLVRGGAVAVRRELELQPGPRPERRVMAFTRLTLPGGELCAANLHASAGSALRDVAERELVAAAEAATDWAAGAPLVFGGDLNVRPRDSHVYSELATRFGLGPPTGPASLDHLLARGLSVVEPPRALPAEAREVRSGGHAVRLSDHAPVAAAFAFPSAGEADAAGTPE